MERRGGNLPACKIRIPRLENRVKRAAPPDFGECRDRSPRRGVTFMAECAHLGSDRTRLRSGCLNTPNPVSASSLLGAEAAAPPVANPRKKTRWIQRVASPESLLRSARAKQNLKERTGLTYWCYTAAFLHARVDPPTRAGIAVYLRQVDWHSRQRKGAGGTGDRPAPDRQRYINLYNASLLARGHGAR